jgi:hypothetical protein
MIQPIDGGALIQALRAGREDRMTDELNKLKMQSARAAAQRQERVDGLVGQLFNGQPQAGVAAQMGVNRPAPKPGMEQAFSPDAMGAMARGDAPPAMADAPPAQAPAPAYDPDVLRKLIIIDPELGGKYASAFKTMGETDLQQANQRNAHMGATAHWLRQFPVQQRAAQLAAVAPTLLQYGFTPDQLQQAGSDLSDAALSHFEAHALDFDKLIDNELAQRKFEMGDNVPVTAGGSVANIRPRLDAQGNVIGTTQEYIVGGGGGASAPDTGGIPKEAADALRRGEGTREQFDSIFGPGAADRVLGGGAGNGTGNFPG